jgi:hypothetical protein
MGASQILKGTCPKINNSKFGHPQIKQKKFMTSSKTKINLYNLLMTRNNTFEYGTMLPRPI